MLAFYCGQGKFTLSSDDTSSESFAFGFFVKVDNKIYFSEPAVAYDYSQIKCTCPRDLQPSRAYEMAAGDWVTWSFNHKTLWYDVDWNEVDIPCFGELEAFGFYFDASEVAPGDWITILNVAIGGYNFDDSSEVCWDGSVHHGGAVLLGLFLCTAIPDANTQTRQCYYQERQLPDLDEPVAASVDVPRTRRLHRLGILPHPLAPQSVDSPDGSGNIAASWYGANSYYDIDGTKAYVDCECNIRPLVSRCVRTNEERLSTFYRQRTHVH